MPRFADRVKETVSGTPGTGAITLGGAVSGFQTFANGFASMRPCYLVYAVEDGTAWEVGNGTLNSTGTTLTRDLLRSSSTGSFLNLTSAAIVFCTPSSETIDNANIGQVVAQANGYAMP